VYVTAFATRGNGVEATAYGATIKFKGTNEAGATEERKFAVISNFRSKDKMISGNVDIDLIADYNFKIL
jgi:hypothetical protein